MNTTKSLFLTLISVLFISSCGSKIKDEKLYYFSNPGFELQNTISDSETREEYILFLKNFDVHFVKYESGLTDILLVSDGKYYPFSGEVRYSPKSQIGNEMYYFSGRSMNGSLLQFKVDLDTRKISPSTTIGWERKLDLSTTYDKSELDLETFKGLYSDNLDKIFYPSVDFTYTDELPDYWLEYFNLKDVLNRRIEKNRLAEEKKSKEEEMKALKKMEEQREKERTEYICNSILNYDIKNYLEFGATERDLSQIRQYLSGQSKRLDSNIYLPKNRRSFGYVSDPNILVNTSKKSYIGPITLLSNGDIYVGVNGYHGVYDRLFYTSEDIEINKYSARCDF